MDRLDTLCEKANRIVRSIGCLPDFRSETLPSDDRVNSQECHSPCECEDRGNSHSEIRENEPSTEPELGTGNRDFEARDEAPSDDSAVNFEDIFENWQSQIRYSKRPGTVSQYSHHVRSLAELVHLENLTRSQLKGRKGSWAIIEYLKTKSKAEWRFIISAMRCFWKTGLRIDWPDADVKAFTGKLPPIGRGTVPREHHVKPWYSALEKEPDAYRKLVVLLVAEFGYRADHLYKLKMADLQTDETGRPVAIVADGCKRQFKTNAPVATYLPPYVRDAIREFNAKVGERKPEDPLIPYRYSSGRIELSRPLDARVFYDEWHGFEKTWSLPILSANGFRHFVCRACESVDLSRSASGFLVGHDTRRGETYRDWYANLGPDEALEEQQAKLPNGVMGLQVSPGIDLLERVPDAWISLWPDFRDDRIGDLELAQKARIIRNQVIAAEARNLER